MAGGGICGIPHVPQQHAHEERTPDRPAIRTSDRHAAAGGQAVAGRTTARPNYDARRSIPADTY
jgi:hypothetical protein